jgi:hypothetical protein
MAPHKHALMVLLLGAAAAATVGAVRGGLGTLASVQDLAFVLFLCSPIAFASLAAYFGRNKRVGRGAVAFAWLFLLAEVWLLWTIATDRVGSTGGIGIVFMVFAQLVFALGLVLIALFQKPHATSVT